MSWLDKFFTKGVTAVQNSGTSVALEPTLNFIGATVTDDAANARTTITITGSAPAGTGIPYDNTGAWGTTIANGSNGQYLQMVSGLPAWTGGAASPVPALSIDWSLSGVYTKTLAAGGNTFTFANATDGQTIVVVLTGAASTVTWPTVKWAGGTPPTQTASGVDVYTFVKAGATIYGSVVQAMA